MFTRTTEYALRAMIWIAQQGPGATVSGRRIAAETGVSPKYLSMILGVLVRQNLLNAAPGRKGGFTLAKPAREISLAQVTGPFEPAFTRGRSSSCPFGNRECSDAAPCGAHYRWKQVKSSYLKFLEDTSIEQVAQRNQRPELQKKRRPAR
jgi:Rrf2 family protein